MKLFDWIVLTSCAIIVIIAAIVGYYIGTLPPRPTEIYIHIEPSNK
jgi:hypothetical protein